jgi:hypothetical protein
MTAVGAILLIIGLLSLLRRTTFVIQSVKAVGVIKSIEIRKRRNEIERFPHIEFKNMQGEAAEFRSNTGINKKRKIGDLINIRYIPMSDSKALVDEILSIWGLPIVLIFIGSMGLYGGLQ